MRRALRIILLAWTIGYLAIVFSPMTSGHPADAMVAVVLLAAGFIPWLIGAILLLLLIRVNAPDASPAPAAAEPDPEQPTSETA